MKAVIQRVTQANVSIDGTIKGKISSGLLVFLGIVSEDTLEDIQWLSNKIVQLRVFNDDEGVMNLSLKDIKGEILVISQFTLHAKTKKGNRPSYVKAGNALLILEWSYRTKLVLPKLPRHWLRLHCPILSLICYFQQMKPTLRLFFDGRCGVYSFL